MLLVLLLRSLLSCGQVLSSSCQGAVSRPGLVVELDLLRKEMQQQASAGRAEAAAQAAAVSSSLEQVRHAGGVLPGTVMSDTGV